MRQPSIRYSDKPLEDPSEATSLIGQETRKSSKLAIAACALSTLIVASVGAFVGGYIYSRNRNHSSGTTTTTSPPGPDYISNLGIQNQSPYLWKLTQGSGNSAGCTQNSAPAACYSELTQLAQEWVGIQKTTGWYDLEYDVFDPSDNNYIGHFGISLTPAAVTVSNEQGVQIVIGAYQNGHAQQITVTPNNSPTNTPAPSPCVINHNATATNSTLKPGVNQSGYEWGNNVNQIDPPTCSDIDNAFAAGFVSIRLPVNLNYLSEDGMTINPNSPYVQQILAHANATIAHGGEVIVEPHNYMEFNGQPITPAQCQQLIGTAFVGLFKQLNFQNIVIEAMNEPPSNVTPSQLVACYTGLITAARAQGYQGPIIIEGNNWATPSALTNADGTPSPLFTALQPLLTNSTTYGNVQLGIHCYFNGADGGGDGLSECIPASTALSVNRIPQLTTLARQNNIKIRVTEIGVIQSSNCDQVLEEVIDHFKQNGDIYNGYHVWVQTPSDSSAWGPTGYPLLLPLSGNDPRYIILKNAMSGSNTAHNKQAHQQNPDANNKRQVSQNKYYANNKKQALKQNSGDHQTAQALQAQRDIYDQFAEPKLMTSQGSIVEPPLVFSLPAKAIHTLFSALKNSDNQGVDNGGMPAPQASRNFLSNLRERAVQISVPALTMASALHDNNTRQEKTEYMIKPEVHYPLLGLLAVSSVALLFLLIYLINKSCQSENNNAEKKRLVP